MAMTMDRAVEILGINRTREGDLKPMIRALGMMAALNTAEENERRAAAQFVTRRWPAYQAACNAARDAKVRVAVAAPEVEEDEHDGPAHEGHFSRLGGTWWCDTCNSPYCDLA